MTAWDDISDAEKAFTRATLRRAASTQERLFLDATDAADKATAHRRYAALHAAVDQLVTTAPAAPPWREVCPNGFVNGDSDAVTRIAHLLCDQEWAPGMLEDIAAVITATGRDVSGNGSPTWRRH